MQMLKQLFDFYINASIHVASSVLALTWVSFIRLEIPCDFSVLLFNFFATITGYNFVKYFGLAKFHHRSLTNWLKAVQLFSFICFFALVYFAFKLEAVTWCYILVLATITFLYAIPFLPRNIFVDSKQNLREIGGLKIYIIALVWSVATVLLPVVENGVLFSADVFIMMLQRFVFVLVLMLPFEIRDLSYDSLKLSTLPQRIGVYKTKAIGVCLLGVFFFLEFFKDTMNYNAVFILAVVVFITMLFIVFSKENQRKYYSSFWVEGLPILWLALLLLYGTA